MDHFRSGTLVVAVALAVAVSLLLWIGQTIAPALIITSFASSCATVLGTPTSRASMPGTIVFGHGISALIGLAASSFLPATPLAYGVAAGISMAVMMLDGRLHPPAAANAVLAFHAIVSPADFILAVLTGAATIAAFARLQRGSGSAGRALRAGFGHGAEQGSCPVPARETPAV